MKREVVGEVGEVVEVVTARWTDPGSLLVSDRRCSRPRYGLIQIIFIFKENLVSEPGKCCKKSKVS